MNERRDERLTTADLAGAGRQDRPADSGEPQYMEVHSPGAGMAKEERNAPLFSPDESGQMRDRWNDIQTGFVDEPRAAVEQADSLVAETIKRLAESFANERRNLEQQWDRGDNVSTEDLRLALQRYRSFFTRLLTV